jgi:acid phosphatase
MNGSAITRWGVFVAAVMLLSACATPDPRLYSTLWLQTAAEYRAEALETYAAAEARLDEALTDPTWTAVLEGTEGYSGLPPAVILDIDETVLDNAPFQGELILEDTPFDPARWDEWVAKESAAAIPGALAFTQKAVDRGIAVFYVTNRSCPDGPGAAACPQETHTVNNLRQLGFPEVAPERVLLKREQPGWGSEKDSRRRFLAEHHRILMLVGDDLGDFLPGVKGGISPARRKDLVDRYEDRWGRMWFLIPNPVYGSWERVLSDPKAVHVRGF